MFTLFRYGLVPIAGYCLMVIVFSIHIVWANGVQKRTWPETCRHRRGIERLRQCPSAGQNTFPDPHGIVRYVVDGKTYTWRGRARDIGLTAELRRPDQTTTIRSGRRKSTRCFCWAQERAASSMPSRSHFSALHLVLLACRRSGGSTPPNDMALTQHELLRIDNGRHELSAKVPERRSASDKPQLRRSLLLG